MRNLLLVSALFSTLFLCAEVKLPSIFSHHAVLARHARVPVWGTASPGEKVTVTFNGQKVAAIAGKDGKWMVFLDLKNSPEGPFTLTVNNIRIKDVMVGEVWLGSGQSNMAMLMCNSTGFEQEKKEMPNKKLRVFIINVAGNEKPQSNCTGAWYIADEKMLGSFSAVSYHFGKKLQKELNTPVGLIKAAKGATYIEGWMPWGDIKKFSSAVARAERRARAKKPLWYRKPSVLYNAMIHPLLPYRLSGVIWYQGESNTRDPEDYADLFRSLISRYRQDFKDPQLPFFWCNLAGYRDKSADAGSVNNWSILRLKQTEVLDMPRTGEAVLTDAGEAKDIHPRNKQIPGERLAALALARVYGKDVPCTGPAAVSARKEGSKVVISFKDIYNGLEARPVPAVYIVKSAKNQTAPLVRNSPKASLEGFALCGKDGKWFWADQADIKGNEVVLSAEQVKEPVMVRCCMQQNPTCNLYNKAGFPVVPFELKVQ